ncbi:MULTISPECIES: class I SAM-dependent methyltransferase [Halolamina]|uniref:Methyltransferase domain-containing protein n=1 Tax=Halolamina pelagica TaxID=699431 RepID=A0A1I5MYH4_9EURY|nr:MULTISPECIES: class I SAM-dependent methyltransferase [Halolamina]NHX36201.1 methyltransferase domain-containing protein [Halolamina sp. R1-12]SFP14081.1 Methyltransferase domain-containing protein [Halolamina pelagica]
MSDLRRANRRLWNEWSDDFQAIWRSGTDEGELPPAPSPFADDAPGGPQPGILDSVEGQAYVELGCGGGQGSVGTAELGADPVVGVDFAGDQLQYARELREEYGVDAQFVQGDVTDLPLPDDRFDVASSEAAFQMVPDLDTALGEAHRVLREGGVFVLSVPHPLNEALEAESGTVGGDYLDPGPREITIDEEYDEVLRTFDRSIADLHGALLDAGFAVRRLIEHQRHAVEANEPEETDLPEVLWRVPQSVRFWAVAR